MQEIAPKLCRPQKSWSGTHPQLSAMLGHRPVQLRGAGMCASWSHCAFRRVLPRAWGFRLAGCHPGAGRDGLGKEVSAVGKGVSAARAPGNMALRCGQVCGGWAAPVLHEALLACPVARLPHRQSSLSLTEGKLEGEGRLQSAWRAQRLSHQMTTGDSEPARICIHFASHLHRICSLPSPHPSIILLRGWGGGGGLSPGPLNGE